MTEPLSLQKYINLPSLTNAKSLIEVDVKFNNKLDDSDYIQNLVNLTDAAYKPNIRDYVEKVIRSSNLFSGSKWKVLTTSSDIPGVYYGLKAHVIQNEITGEVIISIAGTKPNFNNLWDDTKLAIKSVPNKLYDVKVLLDYIEENFSIKGNEVKITGHSLGAATADLAAIEAVSRGINVTDIITFENPGSTNAVFYANEQNIFSKQFSKDELNNLREELNLHAFNVPANFINSANPPLGKVHLIPIVSEGGFFENIVSHKLCNIKNNIVNNNPVEMPDWYNDPNLVEFNSILWAKFSSIDNVNELVNSSRNKYYMLKESKSESDYIYVEIKQFNIKQLMNNMVESGHPDDKEDIYEDAYDIIDCIKAGEEVNENNEIEEYYYDAEDIKSVENNLDTLPFIAVDQPNSAKDVGTDINNQSSYWLRDVYCNIIRCISNIWWGSEDQNNDDYYKEGYILLDYDKYDGNNGLLGNGTDTLWSHAKYFSG